MRISTCKLQRKRRIAPHHKETHLDIIVKANICIAHHGAALVGVCIELQSATLSASKFGIVLSRHELQRYWKERETE